MFPLLVTALIACGEPAVEAPAAAEPAAAPAEEAEVAEAAPKGWQSFGESFTVEDVLPASTLLGDPATYAGRRVRVEGRVADVCQKQGCWMVLTEGDQSIRVTMKDHGFSVDKGGAGGGADVEGILTERAPDPERTAHLKSESARPELAPEKDDAPTYELEATAVRMKRA